MKYSNSTPSKIVAGWVFGIAAFAAALEGSAASASDTITIAVPNVTLQESATAQSGTFEIGVATTGSSLPEVGSFVVNLEVSPASGVVFTGGAATTVDPYIFPGSSPEVSVFNSGTTIEATDFTLNTPPTLANGDGLLAASYSVPANTSGTFNLTLVTAAPISGDDTQLDDQDNNLIPIQVQNATLTVTPSTVYWNGNLDTSWNTLSGASFATNWSTTSAGTTDAHALPGANTDVFFTTSGGGSNLNTNLSAPLSIQGLTFASTATSPVSIGGSALTIGADGLTVQSGAAAPTINSAVNLSASQSWTIAGSNPLTINGPLSLTGQTLTKSGNGTVRITAAPSLLAGSTLAVGAGTVELDVTSGTATVGSNVTATVATGATLQLAGWVSAFSDGSAINPADGNLVDITNNGSTASGGGLQVTGTNQSVGAVTGQATTNGGVTTYAGDTVVGDGSNGASLTATQILQNTLTINAGSTLTIRPSGPGSSPMVAGSGSAGTAAVPLAAASTATTPADDGPIQSAIASLAASSGNSAAPLSTADSDSGVASTASAGTALPAALLPFGETTAASLAQSTSSGASLLGADDDSLLQSQAADSIAGSGLGGLAIGAAAAASGANPVPEPSSLLLLLVGCAISLIVIMRPSRGVSRACLKPIDSMR